MNARLQQQDQKLHEPALAAFVGKKLEIDAMLSRLQDLSDDHFGCAVIDDDAPTREALIGVESGVGDSPDISFALFLDVDAAGAPGSEALLVCPGRTLQCASPTGALSNVAIDYQFVKQIINTPLLCKYGGTTYKC